MRLLRVVGGLAAGAGAIFRVQRRLRSGEETRAELEAVLARVEADRARLEADRAGIALDRDRIDAERSSLSERVADLQEALGAARAGNERVERARVLERHWISELRRQLAELQQQRGLLGDPKDARVLILRVALSLLEAEKGLLLAREDQNADGDLDLVAAEGFEHDPADSAIAQHFARLVIERDQIVREEDRAELAHDALAPADREIENLVAIPIYMHDRFDGVVVCANGVDAFRSLDTETLLSLGGHAAVHLQTAHVQAQVRESYIGSVRAIADALEAREGSLWGHGEEVVQYVRAVSDRLGLDEGERAQIVFGALLRDVGKIGVSESLLLKPGPLSVEESAAVQLHPEIGYRLVQQIPALEGTALGVLHHHERFDGAGYPRGLAGESIPLPARIIAVVDAFSAMTSRRLWRPALTTGDALTEIERASGTQFDPDVVTAFVEEVRRTPPVQRLSGVGLVLGDQAIRNGEAVTETVAGRDERVASNQPI